jgi:hypothetical protein
VFGFGRVGTDFGRGEFALRSGSREHFMRKFAAVFAAVSVAAVTLAAPTYAADMGPTAKKVRTAKVVKRVRVAYDPCLRHAARLDPYGYQLSNLVYIPTDSYRPAVCIDGNTGPVFHPGWRWSWYW